MMERKAKGNVVVSNSRINSVQSQSVTIILFIISLSVVYSLTIDCAMALSFISCKKEMELAAENKITQSLYMCKL